MNPGEEAEVVDEVRRRISTMPRAVGTRMGFVSLTALDELLRDMAAELRERRRA